MPPTARWRFALFYLCYYAALGAYTPYFARWVDALGHGGYVIGTLLGLWYGSRILAPPLWTALLQRSTQPGRWFVAGSALTLLCFAAFTVTDSALGLFAVMALFGLFYNALMPQFEAMTLTALGPRVSEYGRLRVWGSVGFLLAAGSYGVLLDRFGSAAFPWLTLPLLAAMLVAAIPHRHDRPPGHAPSVADAGHLWKRPGVRRFLLVALLMQVGFGPFYVFYTLHLQAHGHDGVAVGALWAVGVLIEIALFWQAPRLIERFGAPRLLSVCLAVTILRWTVTALYADSFAIMALAQATHAFGFAVFHACCMRLIAEYFPGRRAVAGQGLLYGFSSGVGGVLGAGLAALMWERGGGEWAFLAGAAAVAVAWVIHALRARPATVSSPPPQ
ncbi:MAG: MFS transporter [Rehaibacterium terrae]|uniref:MFS transporter n=1 Tax=Rehaibacterium terrae TaxID=1341696 RepID=UPI00391D6F73